MRASVNGISLAYDDAGTGHPVVLVHGFPLNRRMWQPQVKALTAAGYRVINPDLRGFGESETPEGTWGMKSFSDDLISLLDHLHIDSAVIGGMSMGGYVLLDLLARHPRRCSAACFIVTRSGADDEAGRARRLHLATEAAQTGPHVVAEAFAQVLFAPKIHETAPDLVAQVYGWMTGTTVNGLAGGLLAMRDREDYTSILSGISIPSLVIGGTDDQAIPPENSRRIAEQLQNGSLCMINGGGHLVNLEQAEAFNACLLEFLQQVSGK